MQRNPDHVPLTQDIQFPTEVQAENQRITTKKNRTRKAVTIIITTGPHNSSAAGVSP